MKGLDCSTPRLINEPERPAEARAEGSAGPRGDANAPPVLPEANPQFDGGGSARPGNATGREGSAQSKLHLRITLCFQAKKNLLLAQFRLSFCKQ